MTGMLRLVIKDVFMLQRRNLIILPLFSAYLVILSVTQAIGVLGIGAAMAAMAQLSILMVSQASFGFDEHSKFDIFLNALPVKKSQIVVSRYLTCAAAAMLGSLWVLVLMALLWLTSAVTGLFSFDLSLTLDAALLWIPGSALVSAIIVPLLFKFGYMKARYLFTLLLAGTAASIPMLITLSSKWNLGDIPARLSLSPIALSMLTLAGIAILVEISIQISVAIYMKKQW